VKFNKNLNSVMKENQLIKPLLGKVEHIKIIHDICLRSLRKERGKPSTIHMDFTNKAFQTVIERRLVPKEEEIVLTSKRNLRYNSSLTPYNNLKGLKSLSIALMYLFPEDETPLVPNDKRIANISLLLKNNKTLSSLKLDLEGYYEPSYPECVNQLSWALKSLKSLSNLEINFNYSQ